MGVVEGLLINGGGKKSECINVTSYNFMFIFNAILTIAALYFYFKCNWSIKGKFSFNASSIFDKILGFIFSLLFSTFYVAYHLAIPCC